MDIDSDTFDGARNLLVNCAGAAAGDRIVIVGEDSPDSHFDNAICMMVAEAAGRLGMAPEVVIAPEARTASAFPDCVAEAMRGADQTIFFSRLGDIVRFRQTPGTGGKIMAYTITPEHLSAQFGRTNHALMLEVNERLVAEIGRSEAFRITCPLGTDLTGRFAGVEAEDFTAFTVKLFPQMIFPPVCCKRASGRLAVAHWLTSSSTNIYEGSTVMLPNPVMALIEDGRITGFEGAAADVAAVRRQFERVGAMVAGESHSVNSWHTGTNPNTFYRELATDDLERWGTVAFGSPRCTHFHCCGADPGDIAVHVFDATIAFDGVVYWDAGRFAFLERPEIQALKSHYECSGDPFELRTDIGL